MKTAFNFHSRLTNSGENLTQPVQFLPGGRSHPGLNEGIFTSEMTHLPVFLGISRIYAENLTMAQPLLKGELR